MAKKKDLMQETVEATEKGEQLDLIDVAPENAKAIITVGRAYRKLVLARLKIEKKEVEHKAEVLRLIRAAEIQPLDGGKIKFEYDGVMVSVTPRDELVQVKEKEKEYEDED